MKWPVFLRLSKIVVVSLVQFRKSMRAMFCGRAVDSL